MKITIDTDHLEALKYNTKDVPVLLNAFQQLLISLRFEVVGNYYSVEEAPEDSPSWVKEELSNVGKLCTIDGCMKDTYVFKGIQETYEDYYFILEDSNKKISYSSCVGKINYK